MTSNQLNRGLARRLMYVENKDGDIDGVAARIGYATFSKSGRTVYYRGRELARANLSRGNHLDIATREEYWVSGIKVKGDNRHQYEFGVQVSIDDDAREEYERLKSGGPISSR